MVIKPSGERVLLKAIKKEEKTFILKKGENLWFKADVPHSYCNLDERTTIFHNILYNK